MIVAVVLVRAANGTDTGGSSSLRLVYFLLHVTRFTSLTQSCEVKRLNSRIFTYLCVQTLS